MFYCGGRADISPWDMYPESARFRGMRTRTKLYLLALPALPYLFGVALQVSGVTNIVLSVAIFEIAALLGAGVVWALWSDWRTAAVFVPNDGKALTRVRRWEGVKLSRLGCIRTEFLAAMTVFLACNAVIYGFVSLAAQSQPVAVKTGARLTMTTEALTKGATALKIIVTNRGDLPARATSEGGGSFVISDRILTIAEEDLLYQGALKAILGTSGSGIEIYPNDVRSFWVPVQIPDVIFDAIVAGQKYLYFAAIVGFADDLVPHGKKAFSTICGRFNKRTEEPLVCLTHNNVRVLN